MSEPWEILYAHVADWVDWETSERSETHYACSCGEVRWHVNGSSDYYQRHAEHVAEKLKVAGDE